MTFLRKMDEISFIRQTRKRENQDSNPVAKKREKAFKKRKVSQLTKAFICACMKIILGYFLDRSNFKEMRKLQNARGIKICRRTSRSSKGSCRTGKTSRKVQR